MGDAALLFGLLAPQERTLTKSSIMHPRFSLCAMRAKLKRQLRIVGNGAVQRTEADTLSGLTEAGLVQDAVALPQRQRGQSSFALLTSNDLKYQMNQVTEGTRRTRRDQNHHSGSSNHIVTLTHGGMMMLRLHRTCWTSSYLVHFLRKDRKPAASLLLSLT